MTDATTLPLRNPRTGLSDGELPITSASEVAVLGAQLRDEYLRLADARHSWWLAVDNRDRLRWLEREPPPRWVEDEPGATRRQRWLSRIISWLPVESQL